MNSVTIPSNHLAEMEQVEAALLRMPGQVECPVEHFFAPGVYCRQTTMPAGSVVIGHEHRTEHLNMVLKGRAVVLVDGVRHEIRAPYVVTSQPGTRKIALVLEDLVWLTVHPTEERDLEKLEEMLIVKSSSFLEHAKREAAQLDAEQRGAA